MIWVAVVGGIALFGFIAVAVFAVMLQHKVDDVMAEVAVVRERVGELNLLIGQLELTPESRR